MKNIWFVSHYSMPPQYEMRIKTLMYAHYLNEWGYQTKIFSASTIHNTDINLINDDSKYIEKTYGDLDFVHIKCSNYSGNGLQRIKNMQQFSFRFAHIAKNFPFPDVVIADVNCTNYYPIYRYCRKYNIPFYIDMRDLWPMSIVEYYKYSENNPIIQFLYHIEKIMYQQATGVIFSMPGGKDYLHDKGWTSIGLEKFYYINNGVNLDSFYVDIENNVYIDADLDIEHTYKVVYSGSIREANNLFPVAQAAKILSDKGIDNIKIFLFGDGDQRTSIEDYCRKEHLDNIIFKGMVSRKYIPNILSRCNLSILNYKKAKTLKYGGCQNKLFEYMAAGHPVLMTVDMNYNIVTDNNCGIALDEPTPENIADALIKFSNIDRTEQDEMGKRAKKIASEYDFRKLTERLLDIIGR